MQSAKLYEHYPDERDTRNELLERSGYELTQPRTSGAGSRSTHRELKAACHGSAKGKKPDRRADTL